MTHRLILPHEHIFCRFRSPDRPLALKFVGDQLRQLAAHGVTDIVDLTAYTNPVSYLDFVESAPLTIHSCVGFYLERYVPKAFRSMPTHELVKVLERKRNRLARRLPAVAVKVAATSGQLSQFEKRAFEAAAAFHQATGLPIVTHSPQGCREHQAFLLERGVRGDSVMLSHPEMSIKGRRALEFDEAYASMLQCVERGSYLCFTDLTCLSSKADNLRLQLLLRLVEAGFAERIMVSGDSSWKVHRGRALVSNCSPGSGYELALEVHEKLRMNGLSDMEVQTIALHNPLRFLGLDLL